MNTTLQRSIRVTQFRNPQIIGAGWGRWVQVFARQQESRLAIWAFLSAITKTDDPRFLMEVSE